MDDRMEIALRVLQSIQEHTQPISMDVDLLKSWVDPTERGVDHDVLACIVINAEIKLRKQNRILKDGVSGTNA
jgi:hypothetical protein